jgi:uncharacterized protein YjaG (DUF416 family)
METNSLILNLAVSHQAAFSALNCEKMLPSVMKFDEEEPEPTIGLFKKAVAVLYSYSLGVPIDMKECQAIKDEVEAFWPDLDESENEFASYGFDAFIAMTEALNFVLSGDFIHVINCAAAVIDTVDMYVQMASEVEPAAAELEAFIMASPLVIREANRQAMLLEELAKTPVINSESIAHLKKMNEQEVLINLEVL